MADRVDVDFAPPWFLDINNGRIAQCYTEIDRGSSEQAGEWWGQPILVETHAESGKILINCLLQTSRQNSQQSQGRQQGNRTYYCETSKETLSEEEQISLCVGSF